jgi:hypothetical protein
MPDLVLDYHRLKTPIDHPDLSVTRAKLEYPTVDVEMAYLLVIDKAHWGAVRGGTVGARLVTNDSFTDKAVRAIALIGSDLGHLCIGRWSAIGTHYHNFINTTATTADHKIQKIVAGTITVLATEAVDLSSKQPYTVMFSVSGSTLKSFRSDAVSDILPITPQLTATDTALTSGRFGIGNRADVSHDGTIVFGRLLAPVSPGSEASAVIEASVTGSGSLDDPYRPALAQELIEIDPADVSIPDFLRLEKRRYDMLRAKGFTDDEIRLLLGYVPQHQIDKLAVSWGAIDFRSDSASGKPIAPTYLVAIYDVSEKTLKHVGYARRKNLRVYTSPFDIKTIHSIESRDRDWLITENELAYQLLGREDLEVDAVADFYERELINLGRIKDVEPWILDQTLDMWIERAKRLGRDKALEKLMRAKKR